MTGGTGFLGSHLVRKLVSMEAMIHVLARPRSTKYRIRDVRRSLHCIQGDIRIRKDVQRAVAVSRPEIIVHLAAYGVNPRDHDAATIVKTNVLGVVNLLEASVDVAYERFINTGTCFEYGNRRTQDSEYLIGDPLNVYAASKTAAAQVCNLYHRRYGKPIVTIRPFTFFGPHERADRLIPSVILSILEGRTIRITQGVQTRDYTYVEDMADAFLLAAVAEAAIGHLIDVGSGRDLAVRAIVERIRKLMGTNVPVAVGSVKTRHDEAWRLCCDTTRAERILGWRPRMTFDEGLLRTIRWFKEHRSSRVRRPT